MQHVTEPGIHIYKETKLKRELKQCYLTESDDFLARTVITDKTWIQNVETSLLSGHENSKLYHW